MNKITHKEDPDEGHCIICAKVTKHVHSEKNRPGNTAYVCEDHCQGEIKIKPEYNFWVCPECEQTTNAPGKIAGGVLICPTPGCGTVLNPTVCQK